MSVLDCPSTLPPVTKSNYTPKGNYEEIGGFRIYITGSPNASRGLISLYDIFGYMPQTLQGADRLAESLNAIVLVPDFLGGNYAQEAWLAAPPTEGEAKVAYDEFRAKREASNHIAPLREVTQAAKDKFVRAKAWGAFGLCWGGKIVAMCSIADTHFKASGQAHPGRPTKEDAEAITIPHICLAAPSDNKDGAIDAYKEVFSQEGRVGEVEIYPTMFHGWMGGRCNLEDAENAKEFERGYNQVAAFFSKHL